MTAVAVLFFVLTQAGAPVKDAAPASFGGTWTLDSSRSVLYGGGARQLELVVREDATGVKVTERRSAAEDSYSVLFDGKPHEHVASGGRYVRSVRRDADGLVFQVTMTRLADNASISYTERWSVSDRGKTLTIYTAYPGNRDVLKVFAKKE